MGPIGFHVEQRISCHETKRRTFKSYPGIARTDPSAEPTIGRQHLVSLLTKIEQAGRFRFILETNGILLGADPDYCNDLTAFRCLHVSVSLKGAAEKEFEQLTEANGNGFELQIDALRNLRDAGVSSHPAVMS